MPAVKPFTTTAKAQCRNEEPFLVVIRFQYVPTKGLVPVIDCPHCGRGYYLQENGEWVADRPLVILT